jgi:hypothetical protein
MKMTRTHALLVTASVIAVGTVCVLIYINSRAVPPQSRTEEYQSFKSYAASLQLPGKTLAYSGTSTMGCFKDEAINDPSLRDCTFSGTYFYALAGNYRDNGKQIYAFLQQHGFYFESKDSQQKFESKLRDTKITDNLSNSEPIIVDLKNKNGVWARFSLGDKGRLMTPGSDDIAQALIGVADDNLIARLEVFKNPLAL